MSTRGFALAELIVVLAIAGVLATLVAPTLWSYARTATLQAAARQLAASINLGRQIAISRNTTVCVEVATASNIRLRTGGCGGEVWTGPGTDAAGSFALTDGVRVSAATANVVFTHLGTASTAGTYTVLNPSTNRSMRVIVALSGRITIGP